MRVTSKLATCAILFGMALWLLSLWFGVQSACLAYDTTPNVANFQSFAAPSHVGGEGKLFYLFGPSIVMLIGGGLILSIETSWLNKIHGFRFTALNAFPARAVLVGLGAVLFLLVTYNHTSHAMLATQRENWHGSSSPNILVDNLCTAFNWRK